MDNINSIRKDLKIRYNFNIRLQLRKVDREYNALSAAQIILPYLGGDRWIEITEEEEGDQQIEVTTFEEEEDYNNELVGIDMKEDLQL